MKMLTVNDLHSLEKYEEIRTQFRHDVMQHKRNRQVPLGEHARLIFEDRQTIQYQIQEMLRIERIFERALIQEELDTYNPLIPDGNNLKATFMLEFPDPNIRKQALVQLIGIEQRVWIRVGDHEKVFPVCNEDLERDNGEKTASVHFMRFEFSEVMCRDIKQGAPLESGIDHTELELKVLISEPVRESLSHDFQP